MKQAPSEVKDARGLRFAVLRSRFNPAVVDGLVAGAVLALAEMGARDGDVAVIDVPGAFELPLAARAAALSGRFDGVVALGAVIKGETDHYEHVARETSAGLATVARDTLVPVGFGVLTVVREEQAMARSAPGPENKGAEAARATVAMARLVHSMVPKTRTRASLGQGRTRR